MSGPRYERKAIDATIGMMAEKFPVIAADKWLSHRPLQLGAHALIEAALPDVDRRLLSIAIRHYCGRVQYLQAMIADDSMRRDMAGNPIEPVSGGHRECAKAGLAGILAKRQKQQAAAREEAKAKKAANKPAPEKQSDPVPAPAPVVELPAKKPASLSDLKRAAQLRKAG